MMAAQDGRGRMKVFISADMEGTAGITAWDELERAHPDYAQFQGYMTAEVAAACEGARAAGATEIVVKDAHESARNLILDRLPEGVRIIRGWSGHPDSMMFGIDSSFDAAIYTGYHAKAGSDTNPLAHTMNGRIGRLLINGEVASEFTMNSLCAARYGVPSAFLAGDAGICADAASLVPGIATLTTGQGYGNATVSLTPIESVRRIRAGVEKVLRGDFRAALPALASDYEMVIEFSTPGDAYRGSWYPGVEQTGPRSIRFISKDFFEIQRAFRFVGSA